MQTDAPSRKPGGRLSRDDQRRSLTGHLIGDPVWAQLGEADCRYVHDETVPTGKDSRWFCGHPGRQSPK